MVVNNVNYCSKTILLSIVKKRAHNFSMIMIPRLNSLLELLTVDFSVVLERNVYNTDHHFIASMPTADKNTAGEMTGPAGLLLHQA